MMVMVMVYVRLYHWLVSQRMMMDLMQLLHLSVHPMMIASMMMSNVYGHQHSMVSTVGNENE